ncbi:hypothetical protein A7D00_6571 [Trichophyton violaceum]|uniref:Uncharacterized protein n=1 Tax=Trichophyton violaceum TaxID=34388 RepID=A0A178FA87_TRIVO|nr:hypothetical protein A7D00_6571 [Trichophyton violaceum]
MAPGYSKCDIQIMKQWLISEQVKSYINACRQRQENHAFEKARCKEYFAELFYQDAQKGFKMECPPAFGGHWNWPYWLGELFCCGGMVLQLAIAKNPQLSTTKARVTILDQLPAEYKYWAESSLSNYRDEQILKEPSDAAADNAYKPTRELLQLTIPNPYNRR